MGLAVPLGVELLLKALHLINLALVHYHARVLDVYRAPFDVNSTSLTTLALLFGVLSSLSIVEIARKTLCYTSKGRDAAYVTENIPGLVVRELLAEQCSD
jgi:hypothetical protein